VTTKSCLNKTLYYNSPIFNFHWDAQGFFWFWNRWQNASMFQGRSYSHPTCDSICCVGFCLPWACTTILLLVNGWKVNLCVIIYCLRLAEVASIYLQLWRRLPFVSISIAGLSTCVLWIPCYRFLVFWVVVITRFEGKILCIMSFMYYHTTPKRGVNRNLIGILSYLKCHYLWSIFWYSHFDVPFSFCLRGVRVNFWISCIPS
jgi:hypothetical protein